MGMRIRTNVSSLTAQRFMAGNDRNMKSSLDKLSSGYRINKSADDAAGLAISENLRADIRGMSAAKRNANDAVSLVQVAEGSMNEMTNIMIRLRELTVQSASDTIGERERSFLNKEYVQLVEELDRIGQSTEFNGNRFFDPAAEAKEIIVQVGANHDGEAEIDPNTIKINLEGLKFDSESLELGKENEIGALVEGEDGPSRDEIASRLTNIDTGLSRIASERATLGAIQNRIGSTISNLEISIENKATANSRIKDVDFASETAKMTQARIMRASNVSVLAQANAAPELALQLLR